MLHPTRLLLAAVSAFLLLAFGAAAQVKPTSVEIAAYDGLLKAAHTGNLSDLKALIASGADLEVTDSRGRTAVHIAAHASHEEIIFALADAGADMNSLEKDAYDAVTIAAVANDPPMLLAALKGGNKATNITSRYIGTALIAAAHLGHYEVVKILIEAGSPLDHVNNLNWTAMIEAVVLGDGGKNHQRTLQYLIDAGADASITDASGRTPLMLAQERGYAEMVKMLGG